MLPNVIFILAGILMSGLSILCMVLFFNIFLGSYMAMQVSG